MQLQRQTWLRILARALAILGVSTLLGFAFNASNPIGVRLVPASAAPLAKPGLPGQSAVPVSQTAMEPADPNPSETTWLKIKPKVMAGKAVLLDVRPKQVFDMGHIPGAICFPETATPEDFADLKKKIPAGTALVSYCGGTGCPTSKWMAYKLAVENGFPSVYFMPGGYPEWKEAELPHTNGVASASDAPSGTAAAPTKRSADAIAWARAKMLLAGEPVVLVDARPKSHYEAGHIPGAISLPENSTPEMFAAFRAQVPLDRHLIVYCSGTSCSAAGQLANRLLNEFGYSMVEYMPGGYAEWQKAEQAARAAR